MKTEQVNLRLDAELVSALERVAREGRRLWRRLERIGLLRDPAPGREDEAFAREGHGLTDLVKRPTASSSDLADEELEAGTAVLRRKIRDWRPALVLFAFRQPAVRLLGTGVEPGPGPELEGVPTFLLSGPYSRRAEADRVDEMLRRFLGTGQRESSVERTQRVTEADLAAGRIRLPRGAKRLFPSRRQDVEIVLRGERVSARYDPRAGPNRERSAVLGVGRQRLSTAVRPGEVLAVSRGLGGVVRLD